MLVNINACDTQETNAANLYLFQRILLVSRAISHSPSDCNTRPVVDQNNPLPNGVHGPVRSIDTITTDELEAFTIAELDGILEAMKLERSQWIQQARQHVSAERWDQGVAEIRQSASGEERKVMGEQFAPAITNGEAFNYSDETEYRRIMRVPLFFLRLRIIELARPLVEEQNTANGANGANCVNDINDRNGTTGANGA